MVLGSATDLRAKTINFTHFNCEPPLVRIWNLVTCMFYFPLERVSVWGTTWWLTQAHDTLNLFLSGMKSCVFTAADFKFQNLKRPQIWVDFHTGSLVFQSCSNHLSQLHWLRNAKWCRILYCHFRVGYTIFLCMVSWNDNEQHLTIPQLFANKALRIIFPMKDGKLSLNYFYNAFGTLITLCYSINKFSKYQAYL